MERTMRRGVWKCGGRRGPALCEEQRREDGALLATIEFRRVDDRWVRLGERRAFAGGVLDENRSVLPFDEDDVEWRDRVVLPG